MVSINVYFKNEEVPVKAFGDDAYELPNRIEVIDKSKTRTRVTVINLDGYSHYVIIKENENESRTV